MTKEKTANQKNYSNEEVLLMQEKTIEYYKNQELLLLSQCSVEELRARIKKAQYESFEWELKLIHAKLDIKKSK